MSDSRVRVPLNGKTVNLARLTAEVGTALTASDTEVVVADVGSTVTAAALSKAIAAHTPPTQPAPVKPLTDDEITRLRAILPASR